jgi:hypothetical protein
LKKIGVKTRLKNRDKLLDLLKSKRQWFCCYFLRPHVRNRFIGSQKYNYELFFILYCYFLYKRNKYPNSVLSPIIFPRK